MTAPTPELPAPPQDVAAERAVLGAMLQSPLAISEVVSILRGRDFYVPAHALVFDAVLELFGRGAAVDPITVSDELLRAGDLQRAGGGAYLAELFTSSTHALSAPYHARIVADRAVLRRVISAGTRITQLGYEAAAPEQLGPDDATECLNRAREALDGVAEGEVSTSAGARQVMLAALEAAEHAASMDGLGGLSTGLPDLDRLIGGLRPGEVTVIAGRPGQGKSMLALDFVRACAFAQSGRAAFFSLEMTQAEIGARLVAASTTIPLTALRSGQLSGEQWARISEYVETVDDASIVIDDSPSVTIADVRARARRYGQHRPLDLIVVDYLQLMSSGARSESRQVEVAEFSRGLKLLAKELRVPVVVLSQFNRAPDGRLDGKPRLSDMRESGAIEQDCDIALLLHRPSEDSDRAGEVDLIVAKNRNGPTDTVTAIWQGKYSRLVPAAGEIGGGL